eukprot:COSAG01_NODE_2756_length_7129_cov_15.029730_9_plen_92_part_00
MTDALLAQGEFKAWGKAATVLLLVVGPTEKCPRCAALMSAVESLLASLGKTGRKGLKVLRCPSVRVACKCCFRKVHDSLVQRQGVCNATGC